ncbi:MAG: hypothetical protein LBB28_02870, partial [Synergistaceae bacterium]|nr:hypothetical protein [Synergistaceae bacterium]
MAVQMATSAGDLAQVCAPAMTVTNSGDVGAAGAEFKNILQGMRESRQKPAAPASTGKDKEPKTPVNFAFLAGEEDEIAANVDESSAERPAELEMTPDDGSETPPPSRFDPDVFLEALAAAADKGGAESAEDAETYATETEDAAEDAETAQETPAPDSGENDAQIAPASFAETNALARINPFDETNGKTETDVK